jgi:hypothetical protein
MYQEESGTPEDFSDTRPRPFSQVPKLWLEVTKMTEDFFAQEAPRASGANALISVLILAVVTAVLNAVSTLLGGGIEMVNMLATSEAVDAAPLLGAFGGIALLSACYALIMGPVGFYIVNGLTYLGAHIFGGTGGFSTHVYLQSLWVVPLGMVMSLVSLITVVPILGGCIAGIAVLALFIYSIILNVRAIKVTHDLTTGRAVGAIFAPALLLLVVPCLVIVVLALLGPAIGNVFSNIMWGIEAPLP